MAQSTSNERESVNKNKVVTDTLLVGEGKYEQLRKGRISRPAVLLAVRPIAAISMRGATESLAYKCHRSSTKAVAPSRNDYLKRAGYEVIKKIGGGSYSEVKEVRQGYER